MPKNQIIVGYSYATDAAWQKVFDNAAGVYAVILNPNSGVGAQYDSNYAMLATKLRAAGIKTLGYISTRYAARPIDEVRQEMATWFSWYKVDGFFLDEAATDAASLPYYKRLRSVASTAIVVHNPGTVPAEAYLEAADIICTAETDQGAYLAKTFPAWTRNYPATRFYHIVYGVTDAAAVASRATSNHAGYIYLASVKGPDPQFSVATTLFVNTPSTPSPVVTLQSFSDDELVDEVRRRLRQ